MQTLSTSFVRTNRFKSVFLSMLSVIVLSILFVSCKKGDTGPAGATGPAGPAGVAGPTGTANVIYSAWFTPGTYIKDTIFGIYGFNYDKATADITQKVIDSGTVITFGKLLGYTSVIWPATQVEAMPITITYIEGTTTYTDTWSALITPGNLRIRFVDNQNLYGGISNAHQFRYVVIPGGVKSTASLKPGEQISGNGNALNMSGNSSLNEVILHYQSMGYSEICHRLGIPE
jgi:hypothetical protein